MKKYFLILVLFSLCSMGTMAQHRAIGLRASSAYECSYQLDAGIVNFWEFDCGLMYLGGGLQGTAIYNWIIASPEWTTEGDWNFYMGVGAGLGMTWGEHFHHRNEVLGGHLGLACMAGLEYNFWFPLQLSIDVRPVFGPYFGDGVLLNQHVFYSSLWPSIGVRYRF